MTSVYFYYVKLFILRDWLTTFRDRKVSKFKKKTTPHKHTHAVADEIYGKTGQEYSTVFLPPTRSAQSQANKEHRKSREYLSHHKPQNTS